MIKSKNTKVWVITTIGFSVGLIIGILLVNYNLLPKDADAQVYVASSLIFGGIAFFLGNLNDKIKS